MRRLFFPAVVLLLLAVMGGAAWFVLRNREAAEALKAVQEAAEVVKGVDVKAEVDVDLSLKGVELSQGEEGRLQWSLNADRARYLQEQGGQVEVEAPRMAYYFKTGEGNLTVSAPTGLIRQEAKTARLWPEVHGEYEGAKIRAHEMTYDGAAGSDGMLTLTGAVSILGRGMQVNATRMRLDLDSRDIVAENGVRALIYMRGLDAQTTPKESE